MAIDVQQSTLRMLWEEDELVLDLGALQGLWTEEQYLKLTNQTNRLIEFADGYVIEIVSPDDPERDIRVKRADYAKAGIPEYWIVNPVDETIAVLKLNGDAYAEHDVFRRGESAISALLDGFAVRVDEVFDAS